MFAPRVICQGHGTRVLPRPRDHLGFVVSSWGGWCGSSSWGPGGAQDVHGGEAAVLGFGKTHLATALGHIAVRRRLTVHDQQLWNELVTACAGFTCGADLLEGLVLAARLRS